MSGLEATLREMLRTIVREEIRAAFARHKGEPLRQSGVGDVYLSVTKAARLADVAPGTIRAWIRAGRLDSRRAGRVLRVSRVELETFLATGLSAKAGQAVSDRARELLKVA